MSGIGPGSVGTQQQEEISASSSLMSKTLKLLQREDQSITAILDKFSHVTVYLFATTTTNTSNQQQEWTKENIEGPMHLVSRSSGGFMMCVLNRLGTNNLFIPIEQGFQIKSIDIYVMFKVRDTIRGLWFADPQERIRCEESLNKIISSLSTAAVLHDDDDDDDDDVLINKTTGISVSNDKNADDMLLSKQDMQDVLLRLIKNDRFIDILHAEYVKSRNASSSKGLQQQQTITRPAPTMMQGGFAPPPLPLPQQQHPQWIQQQQHMQMPPPPPPFQMMGAHPQQVPYPGPMQMHSPIPQPPFQIYPIQGGAPPPPPPPPPHLVSPQQQQQLQQQQQQQQQPLQSPQYRFNF